MVSHFLEYRHLILNVCLLQALKKRHSYGAPEITDTEADPNPDQEDTPEMVSYVITQN